MNSDNVDESDKSLSSKSKSQIKREVKELRQLGERLVEIKEELLLSLNLSPTLVEALIAAKNITSHGAKRRQLQYIGRLMRDIPDPEAIRHFLNKLSMKDQRTIAHHHMLEAWREKLITEDANTITEFIALFPMIDRQYFRQLVQNAKKERKFGKPLGAGRLLFRYLRDLHEDKDRNDIMEPSIED